MGLVGNRGGGKTRLGIALGRMAIHKFLVADSQRTDRDDWPVIDPGPSATPVRYTVALGFFLELRSAFGDRDHTERDVLQSYIDPNLIIIDEVQERGNTPWEDRMLTYLIDQRYAAKRDTVLIGNMTPDALAKSLGESIVSRLQECGEIVVCDWPSFRTPAGGVVA